jgi:prepilin-type N-terminal cleavage/methylation domain-containing protein
MPVKPRGYTLVELIVVVSIIAILVTLASPQMGEITDTKIVAEAAEDFANTLKLARGEAVRTGAAVNVAMRPLDATGTWEVGAGPNCVDGDAKNCSLRRTVGEFKPGALRLGNVSLEKAFAKMVQFTPAHGFPSESGFVVWRSPQGVPRAVRLTSVGSVILCPTGMATC